MKNADRNILLAATAALALAVAPSALADVRIHVNLPLPPPPHEVLRHAPLPPPPHVDVRVERRDRLGYPDTPTYLRAVAPVFGAAVVLAAMVAALKYTPERRSRDSATRKGARRPMSWMRQNASSSTSPVPAARNPSATCGKSFKF